MTLFNLSLSFKRLTFLLILLININLYGSSENNLITFRDLPKTVSERISDVHIRGFLYQSKDNTLILAAEPNLRSCCVASPANISRQILIVNDGPIGEIPQQGQAVLIEGDLIVEEIHPGRLSYKLEKAKLQQENHNEQPLLSILLGLIILTSLSFCYIRKRHKL